MNCHVSQRTDSHLELEFSEMNIIILVERRGKNHHKLVRVLLAIWTEEFSISAYLVTISKHIVFFFFKLFQSCHSLLSVENMQMVVQ